MKKMQLILVVLLVSCTYKEVKNQFPEISSTTDIIVDFDSADNNNEEKILPFPELESHTVCQDSIGFNISPEGSYNGAKSIVERQRLKYKSLLDSSYTDSAKEIVISDAGIFLGEAIVNKIIPHWYGTPWDISGYSAIPNNGSVGCSYFVSNVLLHSDFNLNRYKLAQKYSAIGTEIIHHGKPTLYQGMELNEFVDQFIKDHNPGLYKVGLDHHTGFLYLFDHELYFIHSNYLGNVCVEIEYARHSDALKFNKLFYIADITYNKTLISKWINGEEIKTD